MKRVALILAAASLVSVGCATDRLSERAVRGEPAEAAFERFKSLAGTWESESTKGWADKTRYTVIANGSVVMELDFEGQADQMASMILLDGARLTLTHYCAAKNQPRLIATRIEPDGREVEFAFLDGQNLPTRDKGHMDRAIYTFVDADRFTSRWTWYEDGKEKWGEVVEYRRLK